MNAMIRVAAGAMAVLLTGPGSPAFAQISRAEGGTVRLNTTGSLATHAGLVLGTDSAYDPVNNVYLVVGAYGSTYGAFVNAATGAAVGAPFVIKSGLAPFANYPRARYSPHLSNGAGGTGAFLVTWNEGPSGVFARVVSYASGAMGSTMAVSDTAASGTLAPGLAYSPTSRRFLVAWQTAPPSYAIRGRFVTVDGGGAAAVAGAGMGLTDGVPGARDPAIAWDSASDRFGISYTGWDNSGALVGFVGMAASSAALSGRAAFGHSSVGKYMSEIDYNSATGRFVLAWTTPAASFRAEVTSGGSITGSGLVSTQAGTYDSLGLAFNAVSGTFLLVGQQQSAEVGGIELQSDGSPIGTAQVMTAGASANGGSFYPKASANTGGRRFDISFSQNFEAMTSQLIATGSTGSGGSGTAPPPPPPPPPPPAPGPSPSSSSTARERARADFNGDGSYDILWQNISTGYLAAWTLRGNSLLTSELLSHRNGDNNWRMVGTGDFNGDGKPDIVWQHITQGWVGVWYMNGLTLIDSVYFSIDRVADTKWKIAGVGDFNGDGKPDLVWQHENDRWLAVWLLNGVNLLPDGSVLLSPNKVPDGRWRIVGVGDINLDGKADLVWRHNQSGDIGAWLMNGLALVDSIAFNPGTVSDLAWEIAGIMDANGDGKPDLVWHHVTEGWVGVWYMNGNDLLDSVWLGPGRVGDVNWKVTGPR